MRPKTFFFHYNKPMSQKLNRPIISIRYNKQCFFVKNIVCNVKTWGHINKQQPKFVVKGLAKNIEVKDDVAFIS